MKMLTLFLVAFVLLSSIGLSADENPKGIIKGNVIDVESGEKLSGANIIVTNTLFGAASDQKGDYEIGGLEEGAYSLECKMMGYKAITITDVQVKGDKAIEITFLLSPTTLEMDEVIVNFEKSKKFPQKDNNDIDPNFTIIVDESVDPDIIIAVDPSVDPGIFMNSITSSLITKSKKDKPNIKILDSLKSRPRKR